MFPLIPLAIGALGAYKGYSENKRGQQVEDQSRKLASETARYSPWTGMTPQAIQYNKGTMFGDVLGGALQGGAAGATLGGLGGGAEAPMAMGTPYSPEASGGSAYFNQIQQQKSAWPQMQQPNFFNQNYRPNV